MKMEPILRGGEDGALSRSVSDEPQSHDARVIIKKEFHGANSGTVKFKPMSRLPLTEPVRLRRPIKVISQGRLKLEKLFKCGICGESFETPSQLGIHIREHNEEKAKVVRELARKSKKVRKNAVDTEKIMKETPSTSKLIPSEKVQMNAVDTEKIMKETPSTSKLVRSKKVQMNAVDTQQNAERGTSTSKNSECKRKSLEFTVYIRKEKCKICEEYLTLDEMETHLCDEKKIIKCEYCQKRFTATKKLLEHLDTAHSESKRFFRCGKCPQFFPMKYLEECHQTTHSDSFIWRTMKLPNKKSIGDFLCEECGRILSSKRNLETHKETHKEHVNEPKFDCPDCDRKFSNPIKLKIHSEIHKDNKYVCEICSKEFSSRNGYNNHRKIHFRTEADRKFACTLCPLKFFSSKKLRGHQAVHVTVRKFHCRFCDQSYKYSGDLNKHLKTHMGDKIHECPKCPMRFQNPQELQKHSFDHYKEEKEKVADGKNS